MFMQVAIEPSLLYENTYEDIRAALAMTIFNAGQTPITVRSLSLLSSNRE
jgi:hypothetical protein